MKKILVTAALALTIATSVISGTLAVYNVRLDDMNSGTVVAKEFKLAGSGIQTFADNVEISPDEVVKKRFEIKNFDGALVTETDMDLNIQVNVAAVTGKGSIQPLTAKIYKVFNPGQGEVKKEIAANWLTGGTGNKVITDGFKKNDPATTYTYEVELTWPKEGPDDTIYEGVDYGNKFTVKVLGTQLTATDSPVTVISQ